MKTKRITKIIFENLKTLIGALIIAVLIRSLIIQPFYIPSSSMEPTLLVGDRIFVTKYSYGYLSLIHISEPTRQAEMADCRGGG